MSQPSCVPQTPSLSTTFCLGALLLTEAGSAMESPYPPQPSSASLMHYVTPSESGILLCHLSASKCLTSLEQVDARVSILNHLNMGSSRVDGKYIIITIAVS